MSKWVVILSLLWSVSPVWAQDLEVPADETTPDVVAEEASAEAEVTSEAETPAAEEVAITRTPTFVVILPERIDHDWYWILYSDRSQHIVQSAIEKALIRAGFDVIDLQTATMPPFGNDIMKLQSTAYAVQAGRQLKADYVISGNATAVKASEGTAYGVNVVRTQAEVTAKIIRVLDGRILDVEDASVLEGGQSVQAAGQTALKKAGTQVAARIARIAAKLSVPETPAQ